MTTANTNTTATNGEATCNAMGGGSLLASDYRLRLRIKPSSGGLLRVHANVIVRAWDDSAARRLAVRKALNDGLSVIRVESCECMRLLAA
ncbi:hypothetical protein [Rhodoferax sp.]|uniref:hypothetical protein n=1 Tax=Rhodoferax sp. TaxID=50421 RepID=UPI00275A0232|nr:hypothetical protein [Rhodoferax sp.]